MERPEQVKQPGKKHEIPEILCFPCYPKECWNIFWFLWNTLAHCVKMDFNPETRLKSLSPTLNLAGNAFINTKSD